MNYLKEKISELQIKLQSIGDNYHPEIVSEVYSKLLLYVEKYFPENKPNFLRNIANLSLNFESDNDYDQVNRELKNALATILEYIEIEKNEELSFQPEYKEALKEIELERNKIQNETTNLSECSPEIISPLRAPLAVGTVCQYRRKE